MQRRNTRSKARVALPRSPGRQKSRRSTIGFRSCIGGSWSIDQAAARRAVRPRPSSNETIRMIQNGTAIFVSPDTYSAAIGIGKVEFFVTADGEFKGQLTHLNIGRLHVLRAKENLPRIAFLALPPAHVHISFSTNRTRSMFCCGVGLDFGDLVFHSLGQRTHQRTIGEGDWGVISLPSVELAAYSKALTGESLRAPSENCIVMPADESLHSVVEPDFETVRPR